MTYHLAETLGMTVADLEERMPADEFMGWLRYINGKRGSRGKSVPREMPRTLGGVRETLVMLGIPEVH